MHYRERIMNARIVLVALLLTAPAAELVGQVPSFRRVDAGKSCFRGRPKPHCDRFWITEISGFLVVNAPAPYLISGEVGYMYNRDARHAFGLSVRGAAHEGASAGLLFRYRRWLGAGSEVARQRGHEQSIDIAIGTILEGSWGVREIESPSPISEVAYNYADLFSVASRVEFLRYRRGSDVAWFIGLKLGSYAGLVGVAVGGLIALVAVALCCR